MLARAFVSALQSRGTGALRVLRVVARYPLGGGHDAHDALVRQLSLPQRQWA